MPMEHPKLADVIDPLRSLEMILKEKGLKRLKYEGRDKDDAVIKPDGKYYNDPINYAQHIYAYFMCFECKNPYFGGMKACEEAGRDQQDNGQEFNNKDLICGSCTSGNNKEKCKLHGTNYISYKCKFCCSNAVWFCWGTTHFCDPCHQKAATVNKAPINTLPKCPGKDKCPLGIKHPANGTAEFCMGCVVCLRK